MTAPNALGPLNSMGRRFAHMQRDAPSCPGHPKCSSQSRIYGAESQISFFFFPFSVITKTFFVTQSKQPRIAPCSLNFLLHRIYYFRKSLHATLSVLYETSLAMEKSGMVWICIAPLTKYCASQHCMKMKLALVGIAPIYIFVRGLVRHRPPAAVRTSLNLT